MNHVQVVPLTSNTAKLYPNEAYVSVSGKRGKAMGDQITTARKERLLKRIGTISSAEMTAIENAVKIQLGLD